MRTLLTILTLVLGFSYANAQKVKEAKVPVPVKEAFSKQYPDAKVEEWEKEGGRYESEFRVNEVETKAIYDSNGNFVESETELEVSELPKAVTDYIASNFPRKKIKGSAKITDASGRISYKAEVGREDYIFDSDCSFVRNDDDKN